MYQVQYSVGIMIKKGRLASILTSLVEVHKSALAQKDVSALLGWRSIRQILFVQYQNFMCLLLQTPFQGLKSCLRPVTTLPPTRGCRRALLSCIMLRCSISHSPMPVMLISFVPMHNAYPLFARNNVATLVCPLPPSLFLTSGAAYRDSGCRMPFSILSSTHRALTYLMPLPRTVVFSF